MSWTQERDVLCVYWERGCGSPPSPSIVPAFPVAAVTSHGAQEFLRSEVLKCPLGCVPSRGSRGESVYLSFPGSFWRPAFLGPGPPSFFRASLVASPRLSLSFCHIALPLTRTLLFPCDYSGPTWIAHIGFKVLNPTRDTLCHVRRPVHRFRGLGGEHLGGPLLSPPHAVTKALRAATFRPGIPVRMFSFTLPGKPSKVGLLFSFTDRETEARLSGAPVQ